MTGVLWVVGVLVGGAVIAVAASELSLAVSAWLWRREFGEPLTPGQRRRLRRAFWDGFTSIGQGWYR